NLNPPTPQISILNSQFLIPNSQLSLQNKYLECWRLRKEFKTDHGLFMAVRDFTLNMAMGEFVSIIGHSGCGKSTVLSMIAGLHELSGGGMVLDNKEIVGAGTDRAVVFQSPNLLPWLTALDNVTLGIEQVHPNLNATQRADMAHDWLKRVGLERSAHCKPAQLSQGMQQRVGIARAFALQPKMLLLDEPFGMLDSLTRLELQDVLLEVWNQYQITTLMVTHDVDEAVMLSDRIVMMTNGPAATIGDIVSIRLDRPRQRETVMETQEYLDYRESVVSFLEHPEVKVA
ncbi:MAG: ABC transporter ATP-binding protein, partial [Pirellula sp.]